MWDFEVWRSPNIIGGVCPSAMIIYRDIHEISTWFACCPIKMRLYMYRRNSRDVTLEKMLTFPTFSIDMRVKQTKTIILL